MQDRQTEIEIKLAHLEQTITELSDVIYRQQRQIDLLEQGYEQLRQRIQSAGEAQPDTAPGDEKPPHY